MGVEPVAEVSHDALSDDIGGPCLHDAEGAGYDRDGGHDARQGPEQGHIGHATLGEEGVVEDGAGEIGIDHTQSGGDQYEQHYADDVEGVGAE